MDTRGREVLGSPLPAKPDGVFVASALSVSATELMLLRRGLDTLNAESLNMTAEPRTGSSGRSAHTKFVLHVRKRLVITDNTVLLCFERPHLL
jgi:hypothetical protein